MNIVRLVSTGVLFVLLLCASTSIAQNATKKAERQFLVTYPDGQSEIYVAVYMGEVRVDVNQTGSASRPLQGHFVDDRQCHWTISTPISREIFLVNRAGRRSLYQPLNAIYNAESRNQGSAFRLDRLQGENCNAAAGRRDEDVRRATDTLNSSFDLIVNGDVATLLEKLKAEMGAASVELRR